MRLMSDDELERSAVVANSAMNRQRSLTGSNGYAKEIGFNPLESLRKRCAAGRPAAWLDLCCGSGQALIEAARLIQAEGLISQLEIVGIDLVGMFHRHDSGLTCLRLIEASLGTWRPDRKFDVITCVHGLHYVGDKLELISRAASWLVDDGMFVANLNLGNLKLADGHAAARMVAADLRRADLEFNRRRHLLLCPGRREIKIPYRYLGADDRAGPNYTGQLAVDSYYEPQAGSLSRFQRA